MHGRGYHTGAKLLAHAPELINVCVKNPHDGPQAYGTPRCRYARQASSYHRQLTGHNAGDATQKKLTEVTIIPDGSYRGMAEAKTVTLVVHAQKDQPRSVMVDGKNARFTYDKATQTVTVSFFWRMQAPAVIRINK